MSLFDGPRSPTIYRAPIEAPTQQWPQNAGELPIGEDAEQTLSNYPIEQLLRLMTKEEPCSRSSGQ